MKQIINSILGVLVQQEEIDTADKEKNKGLSADQKIERLAIKNYELIQVLILAEKYALCLQRAEQRINKEVVYWEDEKIHNEIIDARVKEWLESNVRYNSSDAVSLRLVEKYKELVNRHSNLIGSNDALSNQMNELNDLSQKLLKCMEKIKKADLTEKEKAEIKIELSSLKEGLKAFNNGREVRLPSIFIQGQLATIQTISNQLNKARKEFEEYMKENFPKICAREKSEKQGTIDSNDKRITEIDTRQAEIDQRLKELEPVKQPTRL